VMPRSPHEAPFPSSAKARSTRTSRSSWSSSQW
jgi:hypothetical protein